MRANGSDATLDDVIKQMQAKEKEQRKVCFLIFHRSRVGLAVKTEGVNSKVILFLSICCVFAVDSV